MADFQSSLKAAQIESVLTGAVVYNKNIKLSDSQKAQARANIGATAVGHGIRIIAHYNTLTGLKNDVKNPQAGDAYSVGTAVPYNLYIYDKLRSEWINYGPIRSIDISARFAQDVTVPVSAWKKDTSIFTDYPYKAAISIADVSADDFPIVAFSPTDAVAGNFCPIAYTFSGYVQIFAKSIPSAAISIPAITFIVQS